MNYPKLDGLPTEPGWYWLRQEPDGAMSPRRVTCWGADMVVEVSDGDYAELQQMEGSEFWGPIPLPEVERVGLPLIKKADLVPGVYRAVSKGGKAGSMHRLFYVSQDGKVRWGYCPSIMELDFEVNGGENFEIYGPIPEEK